MGGSITSGRHTQPLGTRRVDADARTGDHRGSVLATSIATGAAGAAATSVPAAFGHGTGRAPLLFAGIAGVVGMGVGTFGMLGARAVDGDDAARGGLLLAGGGAVATVGGMAAGALLRGRGPRDLGAIVASTGTLGVVGGIAAAGTTAVDGLDVPGANNAILSGTATGLAGAAATVGVLAATGALRRAPTMTEAARSIITPSAHTLDGLTPQVATAEFDARVATAKAALEALPGRTDDPWTDVGKGRAFLRGVATPDEIRETMGSVVREPRRLFVGVGEAATARERADLMLERFDAIDGTKFGTVHVIPPTASGDTTEMAPLLLEHATRGDVVTMMTQTTAVQPLHAFDDVPMATETLRLVLAGVKDRIDALPKDAPRPKVELSALCLGALPAIELIERSGGSLAKLGVDHAVLLAPPAISRSARTLAGQLDRGERSGMLARSREELLRATEAGAPTPTTTIAVNPDDPMRVGLHSLMVPFPRDEGRPYFPIVSAINSFKDWSQPFGAPRQYREVAHELDAIAGAALNHGMGLGMTRSQIGAIEQSGVRFTSVREIATEAEAAAERAAQAG